MVQKVAIAIGAIPATTGLVGVIPSLELLVAPSGGGPAKLDFLRLSIWSLGVSIFGLLFAVMLRERILLKERLRFPTGTATAVMVNVLHAGTHISKPSSEVFSLSHQDHQDGTLILNNERASQTDRIAVGASHHRQAHGLKTILVAMCMSGVYVRARRKRCWS